jgi:DNA-binding CsgD family transcriptional regulator/PAS domain-containing protein
MTAKISKKNILNQDDMDILSLKEFVKDEINTFNAFRTAYDNIVNNYETIIDKLYEFAPIIIAISDISNPKAPFIYVNKFAQNELGYNMLDMIAGGSKFVNNILHPSEKFNFTKISLRFTTELQQLPKVQSDDLVLQHNNRLKHSKGEYLWFNIRTTLLSRKSDGSPHLVLSILSNINNEVKLQKEKQQALNQEIDLLNQKVSLQNAKIHTKLLSSIELNKTFDDIINFIYKLDVNNDRNTSNLLLQIIGYIERNKPKSNAWEEFVYKFQEVNPEFIQSLTRKHSNLSPTEIKICVLTRVGLNSKEISNMLKLSNRSIENHKYNIRKKFSLNRIQNFNNYINTL